MRRDKFFYACRVVRVLDGDTVKLDIDLGFGIWARKIVRLLGINAPEIRGETREAGEKTKRRLVELIDQADDDLHCRTFLDRADKYGRPLVQLFPHADTDTTFNERLVMEGLATVYVP